MLILSIDWLSEIHIHNGIYLFRLRFNIILPFKNKFPKRPLRLRFSK